MNKRQANFEALRIVAMLMVITLHFFFKTGITRLFYLDASAKNMGLWLLPSLSMCAVNAYVLISGYFLAGTEYKPRRLVDLLIQVLEYVIVIGVIALATGVTPISDMHLFRWLQLVFPIGTEDYWFMTAYVVMYLLSPFLVAGAKSLNQKQFGGIIVALLFLMSVEKTILPVASLPNDHYGYDFGWFILLFLIATYIRMYGITILEQSKTLPWIVYVLSSLVIWATQVGFGKCYVDTEVSFFQGMCEKSTDYNFLFCLTAAIGLFYGFKNLQMNEDSGLADVCRVLGPMTLGVYLLHEHYMVNYWWTTLLGVTDESSVGQILVKWIICVVVVFALGIGVEWLRLSIHKLIGATHNKGK